MEKVKKEPKYFVQVRDGRKLAYHRPLEPKHKKNLQSFLPQGFNKLEIEIGAGSGRFLSTRALKYPQTYFIGIDKKKERIDSSQEKLEKRHLKNGELLWTDARNFLEDPLPPINILHVYHPDPWPKKKHHKHRFFRSPDAKHWAQAIVPGGELRISTDQADYFEEILAITETWDFLKLNFSLVKRSGKAQSRFEEIFLSQNLPVYKAYYVKIK
jgi:tRNA (guanine-N(7)-)-methyltransferase